MNNTQVFKPTLDRLSQLVLKQYGCHIKYLDFNTLRTPEYKMAFMNLCRGERAELEGKILFPIILEQQLTGAAEANLGHRLSDNDLYRLDHTVRMILESSLENMSRLDTLEILEQQMKEVQDIENREIEQSAKVVNLADHRKALAFEYEEKFEDELSNEFAFLETMSFPFLIEAQTNDDAFKMALEIHQLSGRRIFLPLGDLSPETFESAQSLRELGSATLYTSGIEKLDSKIQQTIVEYYKGERKKDDPQIIVGTVMSYSELKKSETLLPDLVNRLAVGYLYMRQSFNHYKDGSLMDFFVDSLTGRVEKQ